MAREREKMEFVGKPSSYKKIHLKAQKKMKNNKKVDENLMKEYMKAIHSSDDTKKKRRKSKKS